jgi:hypothetical protein
MRGQSSLYLGVADGRRILGFRRAQAREVHGRVLLTLHARAADAAPLAGGVACVSLGFGLGRAPGWDPRWRGGVQVRPPHSELRRFGMLLQPCVAKRVSDGEGGGHVVELGRRLGHTLWEGADRL